MSSIRKFVKEHRAEIVVATAAGTAAAIIYVTAYKQGQEVGYALGRLSKLERAQAVITKDFFDEAKKLNLV